MSFSVAAAPWQRSTGRPATCRRASLRARHPPLNALRALVPEGRIALPDTLPPMAAGVFGYLGYDTVRLMEDSLGRPPSGSIDIPEAMLLRPTLVIVFDAVKDTITVVTPVRPRSDIGAKSALAHATERLSA